MFLVAGLGNPGAEYSGTRHNVGFRVIENLCEKLSVQLKAGKGPFLTGNAIFDGKKFRLVHPTTFINNSGRAIQAAANFYKIDPEHCLICYDDLNLDVGGLRIRRSGSAGGHNGIKDIIQKLSTDRFPRIRIGIGDDFREGEQVKYVLSPFTDEQAPPVDRAIENATDAILKFVSEGVEKAMNDFN